MTRVESLPYLRPAPDRVLLTNWKVETNNNLKLENNLLLNWDPGTPVNVSVEVELNLAGVLADCRLSPFDILRITLSWQSPGTSLRGRGQAVDLAPGTPIYHKSLSLQLNGDLLSDRIRLEVQLLLPYSGRTDFPLAPRLPGSILWRFEKIILLEGLAARFPTELVDFAEAGWLPAEATWFMDWDSGDLHQEAMGGFRLFLNSRNKNIVKAISGTEPVDRAIRECIQFDVARSMIFGALSSEEFVLNADKTDYYQKGSIGLAIWRLIRGLFPEFKQLQGLYQIFQDNPFRLECRLQERLKLFQEV